MRFLVVDDSATMRRIMVNSLGRLGYGETLEARDGAEALARFDPSIACVITAWSMPVMSGLDLVRALRSRSDGRDVPIVMVTTRSLRTDILTAIGAGVSSYIVKPFSPQTLREKLESVLPTDRRPPGPLPRPAPPGGR